MSALYYALEAFANNSIDLSAGVEDFSSMFDASDKAALADYLGTLKLKPAAGFQEGYAATVLAIKANEAVTKKERIELRKEWFQLA